LGVGLRQERVTIEVETEAMMRYLLLGLLMLAAGTALLTAGCQTMAQVPTGNTDDYSGDVAEVVVTAERPARLMSEVVVSANRLPEVVVYATWSPATFAATPQPSLVN